MNLSWVSKTTSRGKPTQTGITTVRQGLAVPVEPAKETIAHDAAFWRNRREEFESLSPGEYSLMWSTGRPTSIDGQLFRVSGRGFDFLMEVLGPG
jgi:hypothetical protein